VGTALTNRLINQSIRQTDRQTVQRIAKQRSKGAGSLLPISEAKHLD